MKWRLFFIRFTLRAAANPLSIMISARNFGVGYSLDRSDANFVKASRSESVSQGKQTAASCSTDAGQWRTRIKFTANQIINGENSPMENRHIIFGAILSALAFLPGVQAVNPAPDGCYPNFTTAEGCNALKSLTTGAANTGVGWYSLFSNTTGNFNTGVGGGRCPQHRR